MAKATFWATVEPTWNRWDNERLAAIKVTKVTQSKPNRSARLGTVTVKLTLDIPDAAFLPLRPEAIIVVPEDMVAANLPITVEATDPEVE